MVPLKTCTVFLCLLLVNSLQWSPITDFFVRTWKSLAYENMWTTMEFDSFLALSSFKSFQCDESHIWCQLHKCHSCEKCKPVDVSCRTNVLCCTLPSCTEHSAAGLFSEMDFCLCSLFWRRTSAPREVGDRSRQRSLFWLPFVCLKQQVSLA